MTEMTDEQQYAIDELNYARERLAKAAYNNDVSAITGLRYAVEMAMEECKLLGLDPALVAEDGTYEGDL